MEIIVFGLGVCVVVAILYAIPILTACSFIYEWDGLLKLVMMLISTMELCVLAYFVQIKQIEGSESK